MKTTKRWWIAVAGVIMQIALGAVYAYMCEATGAYEGALHVIAGVMAISMLLPIIVHPPNTCSLPTRDWPDRASQLRRR